MDLYPAPSAPSLPIRYSIRSLALTPGANFPFRMNLSVVGTFIHNLPVTHTEVTSV